MAELKLLPASYSVISYPAHKLPETYHSLIFSRWKLSLRHGNPLYFKIDKPVYFAAYQNYIEAIFKKPETIVRLAVLSDDFDNVLGFSVCRNDVLDYIHVHKHQRRKGIGASLFPKGTTTISHVTLTAINIWEHNKKYKHLKFNPFI